MSELIPCYCCNSTNHKLLLEKGQHDQNLKLVICNDCGFLFLNPRKSKEEYKQYYKTEYDKYYRPSIRTNKISSNNTKLGKTILKRINGHVNDPKNILEIGSGEGYNLISFKERFPSATFHVIEPSENSKKTLENNDFKVIAKEVNSEWNNNNAKYDIIIMRHVLEHLLNPIEAIKKISESLTEKGILYIAVPNAFKIKAPIKDWIRVPHTFYFSKTTLKNILERAGVYIIETIVEGDDSNKNELFCIVHLGEKINKNPESTFSKQMNIITKAKLEEQSFKYKAKTFLKKLIK